MIPISPVLCEEFVPLEIVYGKDQPEYISLPVLRNSTGVVLSRWQLTPEERKAVAEGADVLLSIWTFNQQLQPLRVEIGECDRSILDIAQHMGLVE
jgi:hypothetical protein